MQMKYSTIRICSRIKTLKQEQNGEKAHNLLTIH